MASDTNWFNDAETQGNFEWDVSEWDYSCAVDTLWCSDDETQGNFEWDVTNWNCETL